MKKKNKIPDANTLFAIDHMPKAFTSCNTGKPRADDKLSLMTIQDPHPRIEF
jgi:hypothetical protein